jgi:hypothetical protein
MGDANKTQSDGRLMRGRFAIAAAVLAAIFSCPLPVAASGWVGSSIPAPLDLIWIKCIAENHIKENSTVMETDHEKTQCACDCRWRRVIGCGALLASVVARKERGAIA